MSFDLAELVVRVRGERIQSVNTDLRKLELQGAKTEKRTQKLTSSTSQMATKYIAAGAAVTTAGAAIAALTSLLVSAIEKHVEFERSMSNVASVVGATTEELNKLADAAREQARVSVFSAREAADAQYYLASAGMSVTQIIEAQKGVMDLAAATQSELAYTAESVASAISQFGLEAAESTRIANVYAAAISGSQATMDKLTDSMRYAGPIASQLGQSLEGTTAQLMALYNGGLRGEQAGTALRSAMLQLQDPTKEMAETLASMNVQLTDGEGKSKPFISVIEELAQKDMNAAQATKIFGQEAAAAMLILAKNVENVKRYKEEITGTAKATEMAKVQMDNLHGDLVQFNNASEELALTITDKMNPGIRELVQGVTALIDRLSKDELLLQLAQALGDIAFAAGKAAKYLAELDKENKDALNASLIAGQIRLLETELENLNELLVIAQQHLADPKLDGPELKLWEERQSNLNLQIAETIEKLKGLGAGLTLAEQASQSSGDAMALAFVEAVQALDQEAKGVENLTQEENKRKQALDVLMEYAGKWHEMYLSQTEREILEAQRAADKKLEALMKERAAFEEATGHKNELSQYWLLRELKIWDEYFKNVQTITNKEVKETEKAVKAAEKAAKDKLKAYNDAQKKVTLLTETESEKIQRIYNEEWEEYAELLRKKLITVDQFKEAEAKLLEQAAKDRIALEEKTHIESLTGWEKYLYQWIQSFQDSNALIAEGAKNVFTTIGNSFKELVTDAINGELTEITDYFEEMGRKILIIWADILAQMVAQWALYGIGSLLSSVFGGSSSGSSSSTSGLTSSAGMKIGEFLLSKGAGYAWDSLFSAGASGTLMAGGEIGTVGAIPGIANIGGIGAGGSVSSGLGASGGAGLAGGAALAGLGTMAAGVGIGAAAIGIMFGVTYGLGSLFNDDMTPEEAIERTESNLAYAERVLNNPNIKNFSPSLEGTLTNSQRISGLAGYTPEQLQAMYYELGPDAPYTYQGLSTAANLRSITDAMGSAYVSSPRTGANYTGADASAYLLGSYADLTSQLGLMPGRQTQIMDALAGLVDQYQSGRLDLNGADSAQDALRSGMQDEFLGVLYDALNSNEITMEHMRSIADAIAGFDPSLSHGTYSGGAGSWESPFDLLGLTNDQFLEMLEHENIVEQDRLETLSSLRDLKQSLKQSESEWAATMLESIQGLDAQNLSAEELATQLQTQLNPTLHITNNLERDLADGMSKVDAVTKARNETIDALLSTTNLAADHEQDLINLLIEHSGNVEQVTADYNRYLEIKGLLAGAHNLETEEIQALLEEGRALHDQLNLQTTDMGDVTSSIDTLVDSVQDLVDWLSNIPSDVTSNIVVNHHTNYSASGDNDGQYHSGGLVMHSGGFVSDAMAKGLITLHGGGMPYDLASDEVMAKLQKREFVVRQSSVNAGTLGGLRYINQTGKMPAASSAPINVQVDVHIHITGDVIGDGAAIERITAVAAKAAQEGTMQALKQASEEGEGVICADGIYEQGWTNA